MTRRPGLVVMLVAAIVFAVACGWTRPGYGSAPRVHVLSTNGPAHVDGSALLLSESIGDLRRAVLTQGRPACTDGACWPEASTEGRHQLLIATRLTPNGCYRFANLRALLLSRTTLQLDLASSYQCPAGAGSAAMSPVALLAVDRVDIPAGRGDVLEVAVTYTDLTGKPIPVAGGTISSSLGLT